MYGRCRARLLVVWLLVVAIVVVVPISVRGQASVDAHDIARDVSIPTTRARFSPEEVWIPPPLPRLRPLPPRTIGLPLITRAAGIIFSGSVTSISRMGVGQAVETVAITFHVERGIRGAATGHDLTIYQWIGLWSNGQRYRVGERVFLFLYPPSRLGLTSSVGGALGRFAVDWLGNVVLSEEHRAGFGADPVLRGKSQIGPRDFERAVQRARSQE